MKPLLDPSGKPIEVICKEAGHDDQTISIMLKDWSSPGYRIKSVKLSWRCKVRCWMRAFVRGEL